MATPDETVTTIVTIGVLGFVGLRLASGLRYSVTGRGRSLTREIVRGLRWRHLWPVPFVLLVVVVLASLALQLPGLDWGWWTALGGQGNPVTGGTDRTTGTVWEWLIPLVFLTMLFPALPLFAHAEERMFRQGAQRWSLRRRVLTCLRFGLIHAVIGIPIGVALVLSVGGAYFLTVYLRAFRRTHSEWQATLESARAHTAYNAVIIAVVLVAVVLLALGA